MKGTTAKHNCRSRISEHRPRVTFEASLEDLGEEGGLATANWSGEIGAKEGEGRVAIAAEDRDDDAYGTDDEGSDVGQDR